MVGMVTTQPGWHLFEILWSKIHFIHIVLKSIHINTKKNPVNNSHRWKRDCFTRCYEIRLTIQTCMHHLWCMYTCIVLWFCYRSKHCAKEKVVLWQIHSFLWPIPQIVYILYVITKAVAIQNDVHSKIWQSAEWANKGEISYPVRIMFWFVRIQTDNFY